MAVDVVINELNNLYQNDPYRYATECDDLKRMGYKIYRNKEGLHKVVEPKKQDKYSEMFGAAMGDVFREMFGGIR